MNSFFRVFLPFIWSMSLCAADGVIEINQACALNGGCLSSDGPNFPITIGVAGSYRLTGSLDMTAIPDTNAIEITSSEVLLDLGGFRIFGPVLCSGTPGVNFNCTQSNPGANGIFIAPAVRGTTVFNGTIHGMPGAGIGGPDAVATRVSELLVTENGSGGIDLGDLSQVTQSRAIENGATGIKLGNSSLVSHSTASLHEADGIASGGHSAVSDSVSYFSGERGFELGSHSKYRGNTSSRNVQDDRCGGGICTERKRYYRTSGTFTGSVADDMCVDGYHMASLFEILETSTLQYDVALGVTAQDSGTGPFVDSFGWVRTGTFMDSEWNCDLWGSDAGTGMIAAPAHPFFWGNPATRASIWLQTQTDCHVPNAVWCIED